MLLTIFFKMFFILFSEVIEEIKEKSHNMEVNEEKFDDIVTDETSSLGISYYQILTIFFLLLDAPFIKLSVPLFIVDILLYSI